MHTIKRNWWKVAGIVLLVYAIAGGLLFDVPAMPVLRESIRNIYFHAGMWFGMMFILFVGVVYSLRYLAGSRPEDDLRALAAVKTGLLFGMLGLLTGMLWARFTWGAYWVNDPKLNGAAVGMLIYLAYMVLRTSLEDPEKRARLAAVYSVFAFVLFFVFIMILPRIAGVSIHPGADGNPALASGDLAPGMRWVLYPAMLGWFIMAWWLCRLLYRMMLIEIKLKQISENNNNQI